MKLTPTQVAYRIAQKATKGTQYGLWVMPDSVHPFIKEFLLLPPAKSGWLKIGVVEVNPSSKDSILELAEKIEFVMDMSRTMGL